MSILIGSILFASGLIIGVAIMAFIAASREETPDTDSYSGVDVFGDSGHA